MMDHPDYARWPVTGEMQIDLRAEPDAQASWKIYLKACSENNLRSRI